MSRNFGIPDVTARSAPGAQQPNGPHSRAGAGRDPSNIIDFPGAVRPIDPADADFAALLFALGAFACPLVIAGVMLISWMLFF